MNVSANSPSVCFFLSLRTFSFSHSFLKYLQGKVGVDISPFHRHAAWRRHIGVISQLCRVMARTNTGHGELFLALLTLPQKRKGPYRLSQNAFHSSWFSHVSAPFRRLGVLCVPPGGFGSFFIYFFLNLPCPILHWIVFPVCYWLKPPGLWWRFLKNHPIKKLSV